MSSTTPDRSVGPFPRWYLAFLSGCAVVAVLALIIGVVNGITNARQDAEAAAANKARDEQTQVLLECFDTLLGRTAVRSVKIGEAAEEVTTATLERDKAKARWVALLARALEMNPAEGSAEAIAIGIKFSRRTQELLQAQRVIIAASERQERVRDRYPVPPPPSKFCDVGPDGKPTQDSEPTSKPKPTRTPGN